MHSPGSRGPSTQRRVALPQRRRRSGLGAKSSPEDKAERVLELWLLNKPEFAAHYGFANGARDRHLPVGLFSAPTPTRASQIFPGGQASIDLIGLNADTLWLFELKAGKNTPAGTITELFFYTSVIRDALCGGPFNFAQPRHDALFQPKALNRVTRIEGVMLGHDIHPLLDSGLISILNDALDLRWNAVASRDLLSALPTARQTSLADYPTRLRRAGRAECRDSISSSNLPY